MALFSDDEDYQDDQGQNQQPLNTLDHIDSSRTTALLIFYIIDFLSDRRFG